MLVGLAIASSPNEMAKVLGDHGEGVGCTTPSCRTTAINGRSHRLVCEYRSKAAAYAATVNVPNPLFKREAMGRKQVSWRTLLPLAR